MEQYIPKSALVAEIERLFEKAGNSLGEYRNGAEHTLISINDFLDTLETKDIDLEKELDIWRHNHFHGRRDKEASGEYLERSSQLNLARHFFELGMTVGNEAKKGDNV